MKTSIKALGAALALTFAASAPALADMNGDPSEAGIAYVLQQEAAAGAVQVSGFTGVGGNNAIMDNDPRSGGLPLNLQEGNDANVFGFRGVHEAPTYVIEHTGFSR